MTRPRRVTFGRGGRGGAPVLRVGARVAGGLVTALLGAALVFVVGLTLRLAQGPLDLGALVPAIEAAATAQMDGARLALHGAELALGDRDDPRPGLRLRGIEVTDAQGQPLFAAPRARIELRPLDLLRGRLRLTGVAVAGADMRLRRDRDGRFSLGVVPAEPTPLRAPDAALSRSGALADALAQGDGGPLGKLARVSFRNARLVYDDAMSGRVWTVENARLGIRRGADGRLAGEASLTLPQGAHGTTDLHVAGTRAPDGGADLTIRFSGAAPGDLAAQFPALAAFRALEAPLDGEASASIDAAGTLLTLAADVRAGAGAVVIDGGRADLRDAAFRFGFNPATGRFDIARLALRGALGEVAAQGSVDVARDALGVPTSAVAQIAIARLALDLPGILAAPVAFDGGGLTARLTADPLRIDIGEAHLARGALTLTARADATLGDAGWRTAIEATGRNASAGALSALWPLGAASGARAWVAENLEAGTIDRVDIFARTGPQTEEFALSFAFRDAVAHYLRPLPPITGAAGWGTVDTRAFAVSLSAGDVTPPGGGTIDLAGSSLTLPDIDDRRAVSAVAIVGNGPIGAILEVLDFPPLGFPGKLGLAPRAVAGTAEARAAMVLPLLKDLRLDDIAVAVTAGLADVAMTPPGIDLPLRAARLALRADTAGLDLDGDAVLGGQPLHVAWTEAFAPEPGKPASVFAITTSLDAGAAARLGIDAGARLTGPVGVDATIALVQGAPPRFDARLDLGAAALSVAEIGWRKAAGVAATAQVSGTAGDALVLDRLSLEAPGLSARGAARLGADGGLRSLDLDALRLGATTDLSLKVARTGAAWAVRAAGAALDVSALTGLDAGGAGGDGGVDAALLPAVVDLDVARLVLRDGVHLAAATGRVTRGADGAIDVDLRGLLGGQAAMEIGYAGTAQGARATVRAPDAGAVLRAAGLFDDGIGGTLAADARVRRGDRLRLEGEVRIDDFVLARDKGFDALLAQTDLDAARRKQRKEGMKLATIRAPFVLDGDVLTVTDAVAYGPSVGVTMSGDYDLAADRLDMRGVYSPAFGVNSVLGRIPLLGTLLTGGEGQGVIGVTFRLRGPADDPEVRINPFSALAPGILRHLIPGGGGISDPEALRALEEQFRRADER